MYAGRSMPAVVRYLPSTDKHPPFRFRHQNVYNCRSGGDRLRQETWTIAGCHAGLLYAAR